MYGFVVEQADTPDSKSVALGREGSSPSEATTFQTYKQEGIMEKLKTWGIAAVIFYFVINGIADNPKAIQKARKQVNSFVAESIKVVKHAF